MGSAAGHAAHPPCVQRAGCREPLADPERLPGCVAAVGAAAGASVQADRPGPRGAVHGRDPGDVEGDAGMSCQVTPADVWTFLEAGCNAREIAAYAGVSLLTAHAMVSHATRAYGRLELAA